MAKYLNRNFEMYEFREEAVHALTPKSVPSAANAVATESGTVKHLAVSHSAGVTCVEFQNAESVSDDIVREIKEDFAQLADTLVQHSKVVVDCAGLVLPSSALVDVLLQFKQKLRNKGSRFALCGLAPEARQFFFG